MSRTPSVFRFLDLPLELRYQVYQELLCDFHYHHAEPAFDSFPRMLRGEDCIDTSIACDRIDTSILRACRAVYREAYAVMIKQNRPVCIHSSFEFLHGIIQPTDFSQVPTVTTRRQSVEQSKGYVLKVRLESQLDPDPENNEPIFSCMVIARDWPKVCRVLDIVVPASSLICIHLDTRMQLDGSTPDLQPHSDKNFFSDMRAQLLEPFTQHVRNLAMVTFDDRVPKDVVQDTESRVTETLFTDSPEFWADLEQRSGVAAQHYANANYLKAYTIWNDITCIMDAQINYAQFIADAYESKRNSLTFNSYLMMATCGIHFLDALSADGSPTRWLQDLCTVVNWELHAGADAGKLMTSFSYRTESDWSLVFARVRMYWGTLFPEMEKNDTARYALMFKKFLDSRNKNDPKVKKAMAQWEKWSKPILDADGMQGN